VVKHLPCPNSACMARDYEAGTRGGRPCSHAMICVWKAGIGGADTDGNGPRPRLAQVRAQGLQTRGYCRH
jgi:hypothetical protein